MKSNEATDTSGKRVALNTVISYGRSIAGIAFGLFSSRWILEALGQVDYGLYGLVGSLVVSLSFVNLVLSSASARFFAVAIGEGDSEKLRGWFNAAVFVHVCLAVIVVLLGLLLGEWAISHWLVIPPERVVACRWVFAMSLLAAVVGILTIPHVAMFTARQRFGEVAAYSLIGSALTCGVAWILLDAGGDRLVCFSCAICAISCLTSAFQAVRAWMRFPECRIVVSMVSDRSKIYALLAYSGWRLVGTLGWLIQKHGGAFVVNLIWGATGNAAYTVGGQFTVHASSLTNSLSSAATPALATSLGVGDEEKTGEMTLSACRFMGVLAVLVGMPLLIEADGVMNLWLIHPPNGAAPLAAFMTAAMIVDAATTGVVAGLSAHRNIAWWQVYAFVVLAVTCPIAWLCFKLGVELWAIGALFVAASFVMMAGRVWFAKVLLGICPRKWFLEVGLPYAAVVGASFVPAWILHSLMQDGLLRIISVGFASAVTTGIVSLAFLFTRKEKEAMWRTIRRCHR